MLLTRILTALLLIPLVLWAMLAWPLTPFLIASFAVFIWAALEWIKLSQITTIAGHIYALLNFVAASLLIYFGPWQIMLFLGSMYWLVLSSWVISYRGQTPIPLKSSTLKAIVGMFILAFAWVALIRLHFYGVIHWQVMLLLFVIVWSADTCAYFAGRLWGKKSLAPLVSPKKTWAGFWGGMIGTLIIVLALSPWLNAKIVPLCMVIILTTLFAVIGDLFESLMKRLAGVKDSGRSLPGHGGILDRIDSLLAALPFYTLSVPLWYKVS